MYSVTDGVFIQLIPFRVGGKIRFVYHLNLIAFPVVTQSKAAVSGVVKVARNYIID